MGGHATPMAPAGSPSATNRMSGVPALAQVADPPGRQRFGSITREMLEGQRWIRGPRFWVERVASLSGEVRVDPFDRLKEASRWMWSLGEYRDVARYLQPHAEALV